MHRAGFWIRAAATLIDALIAFPMASILSLALFFLIGERGRPDLAEYVYNVTGVVVLLAYTSMEVWFARTPGKMMLGLVIAYPDGARADRWTLLLRWSTKFFPELLGLIGFISMKTGVLDLYAGLSRFVVVVGCLAALGEDKRTWHDQWARTAVFRRRRVSAPAAVAGAAFTPTVVPPALPR